MLSDRVLQSYYRSHMVVFVMPRTTQHALCVYKYRPVPLYGMKFRAYKCILVVQAVSVRKLLFIHDFVYVQSEYTRYALCKRDFRFRRNENEEGERGWRRRRCGAFERT